MGSVPVQRFSPAPGIYLDRTGKHIDITGRMEMYGPEATAARAFQTQTTINTTWTQTFADGYSCTCKIIVNYRPEGQAKSNVAQIEVDKIAGPSHVNSITRNMVLNANVGYVFTWTAAHEFGHVLGLEDKYSEGIVSKAKGTFGGQRSADVVPGYEGNLMGADKGVIGGKNIADLVTENTPGYFDDDDQVRLWVIAHTRAQMTAVPDIDKLKMIQVLSDGWFSNDDLWAVKEICAAVITQRGAEMIRNGIDLSDYSSSTQRAEVQAAFNRMPQ